MILTWNNLFRNTYGYLKPLNEINFSDLKKHCCKDLFEVEAKETSGRCIQYTLYINPNITKATFLLVDLALTSEPIQSYNDTRSLYS